MTLLFSASQYAAAAEAYLCGIERRIVAGMNPEIGSVASLFVSRWDVAVEAKVPQTLRNQLGIAIAGQTLNSYEDLLASPRWRRIFNAGARAQRLLFASTGTKDPKASDILYIEGLASPFTVNTMPEATLKAFADHGSADGLHPARAYEVLAEIADHDIDTDALAAQLQVGGASSLVKSWNDLMTCIASKGQVLQAA